MSLSISVRSSAIAAICSNSYISLLLKDISVIRSYFRLLQILALSPDFLALLGGRKRFMKAREPRQVKSGEAVALEYLMAGDWENALVYAQLASAPPLLLAKWFDPVAC